ncbi:MAG: thioredoxin family protein [Alphaproteobacteria bacterium]|nr:thioredoxin family protein [Alphaproteobacteria bacterium]MCD8520511.1 thioredoxin family protein [Alphaproteobacteria bacterium]MCD8570646.1 thioredoxin family protein [Alphaproteobacteria bacterium]
MALLHTPAFDADFTAADFSLKNVDGRTLSLKDIQGPKGTVIAFICNHCPYVKAVIDRLVDDFKTLQEEGVGCAAIMPNDTDNYPDDSFENMQKFADQHGFTFPYLIDETQNVARGYGAVCTPDIFGFNKQGVLQYRGRVDSAGPNPADANTKREMLDAMRRIADIGAGPHEQVPSMGCSIKWK